MENTLADQKLQNVFFSFCGAGGLLNLPHLGSKKFNQYYRMYWNWPVTGTCMKRTCNILASIKITLCKNSAYQVSWESWQVEKADKWSVLLFSGGEFIGAAGGDGKIEADFQIISLSPSLFLTIFSFGLFSCWLFSLFDHFLFFTIFSFWKISLFDNFQITSLSISLTILTHSLFDNSQITSLTLFDKLSIKTYCTVQNHLICPSS